VNIARLLICLILVFQGLVYCVRPVLSDESSQIPEVVELKQRVDELDKTLNKIIGDLATIAIEKPYVTRRKRNDTLRNIDLDQNAFSNSNKSLELPDIRLIKLSELIDLTDTEPLNNNLIGFRKDLAPVDSASSNLRLAQIISKLTKIEAELTNRRHNEIMKKLFEIHTDLETKFSEVKSQLNAVNMVINTPNKINTDPLNGTVFGDGSKILAWGGDWVAAIFILGSTIFVIQQVRALKRARHQGVFIELAKTLNNFPIYSRTEFNAKSLLTRQRIKVAYHNYLDACEAALKSEGDIRKLKTEVTKLIDEGTTKRLRRWYRTFLGVGVHEHQIRLLLWYKNIQKYYREVLVLPNFQIPYHDGIDRHQDDPNHIINMDDLHRLSEIS